MSWRCAVVSGDDCHLFVTQGTIHPVLIYVNDNSWRPRSERQITLQVSYLDQSYPMNPLDPCTLPSNPRQDAWLSAKSQIAWVAGQLKIWSWKSGRWREERRQEVIQNGCRHWKPEPWRGEGTRSHWCGKEKGMEEGGEEVLSSCGHGRDKTQFFVTSEWILEGVGGSNRKTVWETIF